jgi:hypothetical protein
MTLEAAMPSFSYKTLIFVKKKQMIAICIIYSKFRLHFLFSFFKKNIQNNNYGSEVCSKKKQRKKKRE